MSARKLFSKSPLDTFTVSFVGVVVFSGRGTAWPVFEGGSFFGSALRPRPRRSTRCALNSSARRAVRIMDAAREQCQETHFRFPICDLRFSIYYSDCDFTFI